MKNMTQNLEILNNSDWEFDKNEKAEYYKHNLFTLSVSNEKKSFKKYFVQKCTSFCTETIHFNDRHSLLM